MSPIAVGRKNWIHIGSAQADPKIAATLSVVESCAESRSRCAIISPQCCRDSTTSHPTPDSPHTRCLGPHNKIGLPPNPTYPSTVCLLVRSRSLSLTSGRAAEKDPFGMRNRCRTRLRGACNGHRAMNRGILALPGLKLRAASPGNVLLP